MKPYGESYLEMSFKDFVKEFDLSDTNHIWWLSLASSLTNGVSLLIDDKNKSHTKIS